MENGDKQFFNDQLREDDVGLVLRGHLHIEHQLIELVSALLPFSHRCNWGRTSYPAKVELALACGLPEDMKGVLEKLGTLRNDFAHTLSATISKASVLDLYNGLPERLHKGLNEMYTGIGKGKLSKPSSLGPRDLLTLIFLSARQATKAAVVALRSNA